MGTVFLTVLTGTAVYVIGQIILKMILEPVAKLKQTISKVHFTFVKFAHVIHNSDAIENETINNVFIELRSLSGQIYSDYSVVPFYNITSKIFGLPSRKKLFDGARNLIGLGNWMSLKNHRNKHGHIFKNSQEAYENLNLDIPDEDKIDKELIEKLIQNA